MQNPSKHLLVLSLVALLSACNENPSGGQQAAVSKSNTEQTQAIKEKSSIPAPATATATVADDKTEVTPEKKAALDDPNIVVTVNGEPVSKAMYATFRQQWLQSRQASAQNTPQEQLAILNELVNTILIAQDAEKQGLDKQQEVAMLLSLLHNRALAEMSIANHVQQQQVTEQELKALYDKQFSTNQQEYKARHILLTTEEEAKDVIEELNGGADFVELAKSRSTGPSASEGGDLGWFEATQMAKPFADAVVAMKDGDHSSTPVKTEFGWHVILREDSRDIPPPAFEDVRQQLLDNKRRELVMAYINGLRKSADIKVNPQAKQSDSPPEMTPKPAE